MLMNKLDVKVCYAALVFGCNQNAEVDVKSEACVVDSGQ